MRFTILIAAVAASLVAAAPALASPPPNDAFADALPIEVGHEYTGTLTDATVELGEPVHSDYSGPNHTIWFRYRSPRNAHMTVDVTGPDTYNVVAVYTGTDVEDLHRVNNDDSTDGIVRWKARKHRTYRIAIDSYDDFTEKYTLWLSDGGIKGKGIALTVNPGQTVDSLRSGGLRLSLTARRRVGVALALRVSRRTARHLGLDSRLLGRRRGTIDYGETLNATIRLSRAARRALEDAEGLRGVVKLTLPRSTAPDKTLTVPVVL